MTFYRYFGSRKQRKHFSEVGVGMGWDVRGCSPTNFKTVALSLFEYPEKANYGNWKEWL